jgi:hypothetical protein
MFVGADGSGLPRRLCLFAMTGIAWLPRQAGHTAKLFRVRMRMARLS